MRRFTISTDLDSWGLDATPELVEIWSRTIGKKLKKFATENGIEIEVRYEETLFNDERAEWEMAGENGGAEYEMLCRFVQDQFENLSFPPD